MEDDNLEDNLENESDLQEQLLQQLAKYGDSLLDNDAPVKYTGKVKHEPAKSGQPAISFTDKLTAENKLSTKVSSPQKKRKRTSGSKTSEKHVDKDATNATIKPGLRGEQRHVKELRLTLGLTDEEIERLKSQGKEKDGATRHDATKKGKAAPEIVVFDDPAKRKKKRKKIPDKTSQGDDKVGDDTTSVATFDFGRARAEVRKFGIGGLEMKAKEQATVDLLVGLGAKKPKKQCINYKELQGQIQQQKQVEAAKREMDRSLGYKVKKIDKRQRKGRDDIGFLDGQIGKYKRGVQIISKKDFAPKAKGNAASGREKHQKGSKHKR